MALAALLFGCAIEKNPLVGTWRWESGSNYEYMSFESNMSFRCWGYDTTYGSYSFTGTYSYTENTVTLVVGEIPYAYRYSVSGSSLYITFSDGYTSLYVKQ